MSTRALSLLLSALFLLLSALFLLVGLPSPAVAGAPEPLGLDCEPLPSGVRFCGGDGAADRVPSFDGALIDVDVTLPPEGEGPWPTIVLLNGLGGDKTQLQSNTETEPGIAPRVPPSTYHYNNEWYASRGFATVAMTTRGFGASCGGGGAPAAQLQTAPCDRGFVRVADTRYEARDAQHLLGLLADQGIAVPDRNGATGFSYGGGISLALGYLNDRVRCPAVPAPGDDLCAGRTPDAYVPWTSPNGTPMAFAGVYAQWHWSDLIASLLPNGRFLDFDPSTVDDSLEPLGVMAQSYIHALLGLAESQGYLLTPQPPGGADSEWDLLTAVALLDAGEPYGDQVRMIAEAFQANHGGFGIPGTPAPMLLETGWNDDLFTPAESLRVYLDLNERFANPDVVLLIGDLGHSRDANRDEVSAVFNDLATDFFDSRLRGVGDGPAPGSVTVMTTTCPARGEGAVPDGGPFTSASWEAAHPFATSFGDPAAQTVTHPGGNPDTGNQFDPIPEINPAGTNDPCKTVAAEEAPGTAIYSLTVPQGGLALLGRPTIRASITTTGPNGQLNGRLWDVDPVAGTQRLISRGVYRLLDDQAGDIVFQLSGNGYDLETGHEVKLELVGSDAPQFRASNGAFSVDVTDLTVELPLRVQPVAAPSPSPSADPSPPASPTPTTAPSASTSGGGSGPAMPATGGHPPWWVGLVLVAGAWLARWGSRKLA